MNEYDLHFGADVHCTDGKCGRLSGVAVNRNTREVTHVLVEAGLLLKKARVFPFSLVAQVGQSIDLSIASESAGDYPHFREETILTDAGGGIAAGMIPGGQSTAVTPAVVRHKVRQGVPDEQAVIERGVPVISPDGRAGRLDHLLIDAETRVISGLVLESGVLFTNQRLVPGEMIESIAETGIYINSTPEQMDNLQPYVRGESGEPVLVDPTAKRVVEESSFATEGPGYRVARALDGDPRTADAPIEVVFERGIITLSGFVDSPQTRAAAEAIASAEPGVVSVVNSLKLDL